MMFLLVHSKSKQSISASRRRRSLNLLAPRIDEPALRARRRIVGNHAALDAAVLEGGEIVARRPDARGELLAEQIAAGGEAFEADLAVAVVFVAHDVEIVLPACATGRSAPHQSLTRSNSMKRPALELADLVAAAAERNVERRFDRTGAWHNRRARRSAGRRRTAARRARALPRTARRRCDRRSPRALFMSRRRWVMSGWPLLFQRRQRPGDVMGGERAAVVEFRLGRSGKV